MDAARYYAIIKRRFGYRFVAQLDEETELWETPDGAPRSLSAASAIPYDQRARYLAYQLGYVSEDNEVD